MCVCVKMPPDLHARSSIGITSVPCPPPPLAILPYWGGASLGPKSIGNIRCRRCRRKFFFRLYYNCCSFSAIIVWCNRHFVTVSPHMGGNRHDIGEEISRGGGGQGTWFRFRLAA